MMKLSVGVGRNGQSFCRSEWEQSNFLQELAGLAMFFVRIGIICLECLRTAHLYTKLLQRAVLVNSKVLHWINKKRQNLVQTQCRQCFRVKIKQLNFITMYQFVSFCWFVYDGFMTRPDLKQYANFPESTDPQRL